MTIDQNQIFQQIVFTILAFLKHSSLLSYLSQKMSLNIDIKKKSSCERFWCVSHRAQKITDFITELQRCESWENVPLEFSRLSIDSIMISVAFHGFDPLQFCSSKLRWIQDVEEPFRGITQNPRKT